VPELKKGAFVVGGEYGRGFALCRNQGQGWGPPAAVRIEGGSFGLQIGVSSMDVVLLVMNERGMKRLTTSKFTIGADATAAAGPVGRDATAQTDALMTAEILSWSRARGLFAGLELAGAVIKQDKSSTRDFYGRMVPFKTSLKGQIEAPKEAYPFLSTLAKWAQAAAK
jgi:lipid-binding SYLF domain-containing protein